MRTGTGAVVGQAVSGAQGNGRDPVQQDLIPRPDGHGKWWKNDSDPNARSQMLF